MDAVPTRIPLLTGCAQIAENRINMRRAYNRLKRNILKIEFLPFQSFALANIEMHRSTNTPIKSFILAGSTTSF